MGNAEDRFREGRARADQRDPAANSRRQSADEPRRATHWKRSPARKRKRVVEQSRSSRPRARPAPRRRKRRGHFWRGPEEIRPGRRRVVSKTIRLRDADASRRTSIIFVFAQPRALGRKVSDEYTVPVCRTHHREPHSYGDEASWRARIDVDPVPIALALWRRTRPDRELAEPGARAVQTENAGQPCISSSERPSDLLP